MQLGDEIAVLDGLADLPNAYARRDVLDPSSGANYQGGSSFAPGLPLLPSSVGLADLPNAYSQMDVLDASAGANYSGGSSFAPGLPLLPSSAGLADADLEQRYGIATGVLRPRTGVIDPSVGANYQGGSSYAPGLPLLPSSAGLAGTYEGKPLQDVDRYWGSTMGVDDSEYSRAGVLDPSSGANYQGGSSYAPGLPLLPSSAGLAGLDAVSDDAFKKMLKSPKTQKAFMRLAGKQALVKNKLREGKLKQAARRPQAPENRWKIMQALKSCQADLNKQRMIRANVVNGSKASQAAERTARALSA